MNEVTEEWIKEIMTMICIVLPSKETLGVPGTQGIIHVSFLLPWAWKGLFISDTDHLVLLMCCLCPRKHIFLRCYMGQQLPPRSIRIDELSHSETYCNACDLVISGEKKAEILGLLHSVLTGASTQTHALGWGHPCQLAPKRNPVPGSKCSRPQRA